MESSSCTTSQDKNSSLNGDILSKLRRLKISESYLIKKAYQYALNDNKESDLNIQSDKRVLEFKEFVKKTRNSQMEIKKLFEDIKINTNSQDNLRDLDIEEVKRDILELENKIKSYKSYIQSELQSLKCQEKDITRKLQCDKSTIQNKQRLKINVKAYKDIVPSPVKNIIYSPFKHEEVQQYQEFIKNSGNSYGGWNEYSHLLFVQYWTKYIYGNINLELDINDEQMTMDFVKADFFQAFLHKIIQSLPGIKSSDVITHTKWYLKYMCLKRRQDIALEKWKENKVKKNSKSKARKVAIKNYTPTLLTPDKNCQLERKRNTTDFTKRLNFNELPESVHTSNMERTGNIFNTATPKKVDLLSRIRLPTEQWNNKVKSEREFLELANIDNINKLRIPEWRRSLIEKQ